MDVECHSMQKFVLISVTVLLLHLDHLCLSECHYLINMFKFMHDYKVIPIFQMMN